MQRLVLFIFGASTLFIAPAQAEDASSLAVEMAVNAAREAKDACGGRGLYDVLVPDGPFIDACKTHDACYRSDAKDQGVCDRNFLRDMRRICTSNYDKNTAPIKHHTCNSVAYTYFRAVNSKFGSFAYSRGGIGGEIVSHQQRRIEENDRSGDELEICVEVKNTAHRIQEYELQLFDAGGVWVDTEPDLHDLDVQPGQVKRLCVDSDHAWHRNWETMGETYSVVLRVDDPDHLSPFDEKIALARLVCEKDGGVCRAG